MLYFQGMPTLSYDSYVAINIFNQKYFTTTVTDDYIKYYRMGDDETLWHVSKKFYNDENYWWILAILNNIKDIFFDLPLDYDILKEKTKSETSQYLKVTSSVALEVNINDVISYSTLSGVVRSYIFDNTDYYLKVTPDYHEYLFPSTSFSAMINGNIYNILDYTTNTTLSITEDTSEEQWLTNYLINLNANEEVNNNKKIIKIIKEEYINDFVSDLGV